MSKKTTRIIQRKAARELFIKTLSSAFTKCEYCWREIVWRELLPLNCQVLPHIKANEIKWRERQPARYKLQTWVKWNKPCIGLTATVDHIIPLSSNGSNNLSNLAGTCYECNTGKDAFTGRKCKMCQKMLTNSDFESRCTVCPESNYLKLPKWKRNRYRNK
jgi:acetyl-CoA carboxylase beta subunit